jgi:hypothetical protein
MIRIQLLFYQTSQDWRPKHKLSLIRTFVLPHSTKGYDSVLFGSYVAMEMIALA